MIDTNIYKRQITQFFVYDKCFNHEEDARKYAEELEEYNKEYFSLDDPADALVKLIDIDIIPYLTYINKSNAIYDIHEMISNRQPYKDDRHYIHLYITS